MEPNEVQYSREIEVSHEEKQRLFLLAGSVLLAHDGNTYRASEGKPVYKDSNDLPVTWRTLDANIEDEKWAAIGDLGINRARISYWPERTRNGEKFPDQINLEVVWDNRDFDLFTMKLVPDGESYRVLVGNRQEMKNMKMQWMEISCQDANKMSQVLAKLADITGTGLATP